jgi:hypothetical protein
MRWEDLLRQLPSDAGVRASRARQRALARLDEQPRRARRPWLCSPALAGLLIIGVLWFRQAWPVETLAWQPPAPPVTAVAWQPLAHARGSALPSRDRKGADGPQRLQVQLALSDGTRVYWTFDRNFHWRGTL